MKNKKYNGSWEIIQESEDSFSVYIEGDIIIDVPIKKINDEILAKRYAEHIKNLLEKYPL